jgi:thiamine biosynthesis lipoprotein
MRKQIHLIITVFILFTACQNEPENTKYSGPVFGTYFNITYFSEQDSSHEKAIDSIFEVINSSLSTYWPDSDISKFNRNENIEVDEHFEKVFKTSKKIFKETKGIFDPTIGNVVNAWNFGPEEDKFLTDSATIANLMKYVGFDKVIMLEDRFIRPDSVFLDFNAIAKGYAIDEVSEFLAKKGIDNYLVDIGGDLRAGGTNIESGQPWAIGVDDPNFDGSQSYSKVITLSNKGMATSGVYRKFKVDKDGNQYAHIIDTSTGYPTKTNVLSVSVIASNCMLADGYATAFQAMGVEKTKAFLEFHPELQVYFIVNDGADFLSTIALNGFPED